MTSNAKPVRKLKTVRLGGKDDAGCTKHGVNYLAAAMGDPAELVYRAMKNLSDANFDTMVGRGLSGALVVPMLARAMNKWFAIVRKGESCHSTSMLEGRLGDRWLFVDDLICSGSTFMKTAKAVGEEKSSMVCAGMYMYGTSEKSPSVFYRGEQACRDLYGHNVYPDMRIDPPASSISRDMFNMVTDAEISDALNMPSTFQIPGMIVGGT